MLILLIRHSQAELREDWNDLGYPDMLRPLTKAGISRWTDAISGLGHFISEIDHIYTSQATRTIQTGEILHGHYKNSKLTKLSELNSNGNFKGLKKYLRKHDKDSTLALVGHGSDLAKLTSYISGSEQKMILRHKKGGVALISIEGESTQLQWLLTQRQLCYFSTI